MFLNIITESILFGSEFEKNGSLKTRPKKKTETLCSNRKQGGGFLKTHDFKGQIVILLIA
jgi:hypothetical protein